MVGLAAWKVLVLGYSFDTLIPRTSYAVDVAMSFTGYGDDVTVRTFLPASDDTQLVTNEAIDAPGLSFAREQAGRSVTGSWSARRFSGPGEITVSFDAQVRPVRYTIDPGLRIPDSYPESLAGDLAATDVIQLADPLIRELSGRTLDPERRVERTLASIYSYVSGMGNRPFKGTTDAVTAARLGEASCNGKSRLFAALARSAGIPARLVGGVILEPGTKRTSHQWVEAYVAGHWVAFDALNRHWASLPDTYLALYRGDEALFVHTPNIGFDYRFAITRRIVTNEQLARFLTGHAFNLYRVLNSFRRVNISLPVLQFLLMIPFGVLVVVVARNVIGVNTFGTFLPALMAVAVRETGLLAGTVGFLVILGMAALARVPLRRLGVLHTPKLAILMVVAILTMLGLTVLRGRGAHRRALLGGRRVPVPHRHPHHHGRTDLAQRRGGRLAQDRHHNGLDPPRDGRELRAHERGCRAGPDPRFPRALPRGDRAQPVDRQLDGAPGERDAALPKPVRGRAEGARRPAVSRPDFGRLGAIMGINRRNLEMIYPHNPRSGFPAVDNKVRTKELLSGAGVPVPRTIAVVSGFLQARRTVEDLRGEPTFVVKPARGRGGGGVLILERSPAGWRTPSGREIRDAELLQHFGDILFGVYSFGRADDAALVEQRVTPHPFFRSIHPRGIPDIRIILLHERPVMSMLRIPTDASDGRANLHQGAVGVQVDLATGRTGMGSLRGAATDRHPDSGVPLTGLAIPFWDRILAHAVAAAGAVPLKYVGVDLVIDEQDGPLMLEVNARPGLQIQVINRTGLAPLLAEAGR